MHKVSVIIPFFNGLKGLEECLLALRNQSYPAANIETIAVDNGSTEDVAAVKTKFPYVRWIKESRIGSYAARNAGISLSTGEIVAFTDADCVPEPGWIDNGVKAVTQGASLVGGRVALMDPIGRALNPYEIFEETFFGMTNQQRLVEKSGFAATANLIVQRAVFDRVGTFDPELRSSGDKEFGQRATRCGERLVYSAAACVRHPRRSSFSDILKKTRRIVGGKMILMKKRGAGARAVLHDLYLQSPLNPKVHLFAVSCRRVQGVRGWIHFVAVIELLSVIALCEKIRVLVIGSSYRG